MKRSINKDGNDEEFIVLHDNGEVTVKIGDRLFKTSVSVALPQGTMAVMGMLSEINLASSQKEASGQ